jgi:hypothetical protein
LYPAACDTAPPGLKSHGNIVIPEEEEKKKSSDEGLTLISLILLRPASRLKQI